jgi:hypothetical protein
MLPLISRHHRRHALSISVRASRACRRIGAVGEYLLWLLAISGMLTAPLCSSQAVAVPASCRDAPSSLPCNAALLRCGTAPSVPVQGPGALESHSLPCVPISAEGEQTWPVPDGSWAPLKPHQGDRPLCCDAGLPSARTGGSLLSAADRDRFAPPGLGLTAVQGQDSSANKEKDKNTVEQGSPKHIFLVVPAFHVTYLQTFKPMTSREKFDEWLQGTYDPRGLGLYAFEAATLEHSSKDGFCGYGNGWGGYGKCFGATELDANISSFFGDFLFPVIMHQDPRYFRLGEGSFGKRVGYALSRVFVTHADSGRTVFFASALSGTVLGAAASNLYYPVQDRSFGHTVNRMGLDLGNTALFNAAAEFWPDISRKVHKVFGR